MNTRERAYSESEKRAGKYIELDEHHNLRHDSVISLNASISEFMIVGHT